MANDRKNRIDIWLHESPINRFSLLLAMAAIWLLFDFLIAIGLVLAGSARIDQFYLTEWLSPAVRAHSVNSKWRELLAQHARLYPSYMDRFEADGLLGYRLVSNFLTVVPPPLGSWVSHTFWFTTNDQGFPLTERAVERVGRHYEIPKMAGVFRILMLGGSTVEGYGVNSPLDSLPSKLQGLLSDAFAQHSHLGFRHIELINAGVTNYASDQEYLSLLVDLLRFEPDLVVVYDGWNDSEVLPVWIGGDPWTRPYRGPPQQANADRVNRTFTVAGAFGLFVTIASKKTVTILDGFVTFHIAHRAIHGLAGMMRLGDAGHAEPSYDPAYSLQAARFFLANRERMLLLAEQNGFRFAALLQPLMLVDNKIYTGFELAAAAHLSPIQRRERELFYSTVRPLLTGFAAAREVPERVCIRDISATSFAGITETVYADSGHLLPSGNQIVAEHILAELQRCHLLPW
jgi:hypothetical protein